MDFLSSAVVLWRFFAPNNVSQELELKLLRREKRASIAISIILVLLGVSVIIAAADDLSRGQENPQQQQAVVGISFVSILIFGVLAVLKFHYSVRLQSPSLYKDGVCSLIGTILAIGLFVNTLIIESAPDAWIIDPIVAAGAGIGAIIFGMYGVIVAIVREKLPIWKCSWWFTSQGDVKGGEGQNRPGPEHFRSSGTAALEVDSGGEEDAIV